MPYSFSFVRKQLQLIDKEAEINRVDKNTYTLKNPLCKKHNLTVKNGFTMQPFTETKFLFISTFV